MSFTAEEIARFDDVLSDMFESELTFAILAELALLTVILILALPPAPRGRIRDGEIRLISTMKRSPATATARS